MKESLEFLTMQLRGLGFTADKLKDPLQKALAAGDREFTLSSPEVFKTARGEKKIVFKLNYKRGESKVFLNSFEGTADGEQNNFRVRLSTGRAFTAKEVLNLLEGRAVYREGIVNKEGLRYNAWNAIDFAKPKDGQRQELAIFTDGYGFDLREKIEQLPIVGIMNENAKEALLKSLKKGNEQFVTVTTGNGEERLYIAADPRFKAIQVKDENGHRVEQGILGTSHTLQEDKKQGDEEFKLTVPQSLLALVLDRKLESSVIREYSTAVPDKILGVFLTQEKKTALLTAGELRLDKNTHLKIGEDGKIRVQQLDRGLNLSDGFLKKSQTVFQPMHSTVRTKMTS